MRPLTMTVHSLQLPCGANSGWCAEMRDVDARFQRRLQNGLARLVGNRDLVDDDRGLGRAHASAPIWAARTRRHIDDGGLVCDARVGFGRHGGGLLMMAIHLPESRRLCDCVIQMHRRAAGDDERRIDAERSEAFNDIIRNPNLGHRSPEVKHYAAAGLNVSLPSPPTPAAGPERGHPSRPEREQRGRRLRARRLAEEMEADEIAAVLASVHGHARFVLQRCRRPSDHAACKRWSGRRTSRRSIDR